MAKPVLILQTETKASKSLAEYFSKRGDRVWQVGSASQAAAVIKREKPEIIFIDIHIPVTDLSKLLKFTRREIPAAGIVITNKHPDFRREMLARELGSRVFLRFPFTPKWIEAAVNKAEKGDLRRASYVNSSEALPRVKVPMRYKITFPYALLAMLFALASAFLVSRYVLESVMDRFTVQLIDSGKLSADWMVQEEGRLLETLRLVAHTEELVGAVRLGDSEQLKGMVLPILMNSQEDTVELLDAQGISLLSIHHGPGTSWEETVFSKGDTSFAGLSFVQAILQRHTDVQGDKFAGVVDIPSNQSFYVAGPIYDSDQKVVGVVLVGKSLERLASEIREDTLGQITIYRRDGQPLASTIFIDEGVQPLQPELVPTILDRQDKDSTIRDIRFSGNQYSEILAPWEVRDGTDIGLIGTALAQNFFSRPSVITRVQIFLIVLVGLVAVIFMGVFLANQITNPLSKVVEAAIELARGNLDVKVPSQGNDEVSVLAYAFNYMVSGLQEGIIYRDLLGRTVSPQVRETLRRSFASGDLRLEGQSAEATILMSDIRGFTALAEKEEPTKILHWLNEYFGELVPVIASHGGVVDKFEGDAMLAFFGILPTPLRSQDSAYQACQAAVKMLLVIQEINARRIAKGEPPLNTGIGVNTGSLIAGGLGTADRLNYTVIGDTVNTTQRIQGLTRSFGESGIIVSEYTLMALDERRAEFNVEPLGEHTFKGKLELVWLYRLYPSSSGNSTEPPLEI